MINSLIKKYNVPGPRYTSYPTVPYWKNNNLSQKEWTDEFSKVKYENVFALESVCDFPDSIKEGDSFRFRIDREKENLCAVCLAYTAVPRKFVSITVIKN